MRGIYLLSQQMSNMCHIIIVRPLVTTVRDIDTVFSKGTNGPAKFRTCFKVKWIKRCSYSRRRNDQCETAVCKLHVPKEYFAKIWGDTAIYLKSFRSAFTNQMSTFKSCGEFGWIFFIIVLSLLSVEAQ